MEKVIVGIDLGGTAIKGGVLSKAGEVLTKGQIPTEREKGVDGVLQNVVKLMNELLAKIGKSEKDVFAMGFGVPGIVDDQMKVIEATNIGWTNVDVISEIKKFTNVQVFLGNDANVAALGEVKFGVAKGMKDAFLITLGTGVGSGFIIGGKIFAGNKGCGAEIGHAVLVKNGDEVCNCGQRGCVEAYLSATALIRFAKREMEKDKETLLWKVCDIDNVGAKDIFSLYKKDKVATSIIDQYIERLYDLCLNLSNAFRPEAIIFGGGVSLAGKVLTEPIQKMIDEHIFAKDFTPTVKILSASLGNDAGFIGAASLCVD